MVAQAFVMFIKISFNRSVTISRMTGFGIQSQSQSECYCIGCKPTKIIQFICHKIISLSLLNRELQSHIAYHFSNSFFQYALDLLNSLPLHIRNVTSFRKHLKTHLFKTSPLSTFPCGHIHNGLLILIVPLLSF